MAQLDRRLVRSLLAIALVIMSAVIVLAFDIWRSAAISSNRSADAALVLGAAVFGSAPSPVLIERLRHAKMLYEAGRIKHILVAGGRSPDDALSEAEAGRDWLAANGVPSEAILIEDQSRTTVENLTNAKPLLIKQGLHEVLIVSDPLHMRRALLIARRIGISGEPSPTMTSRYRSWRTALPFLARETWFTAQYLMIGL